MLAILSCRLEDFEDFEDCLCMASGQDFFFLRSKRSAARWKAPVKGFPKPASKVCLTHRRTRDDLNPNGFSLSVKPYAHTRYARRQILRGAFRRLKLWRPGHRWKARGELCHIQP